jgi:hypothetical protein
MADGGGVVHAMDDAIVPATGPPIKNACAS